MFVEVKPPTEKEFGLFQDLIRQQIGVFLPEHKRPLLHNRLSSRLRDRRCVSFQEYFELITSKYEEIEKQLALELITTNETYFFREPQHFEFLQHTILPSVSNGENFRVWSAASSSGEEAYSIAMVLSEYSKTDWHILASDINQQMLDRLHKGIYADVRTSGITADFRQKYCLQGINEYAGSIRMVPELRKKIASRKINLTQNIMFDQKFDLIFIRNAMIYFEKNTQVNVVNSLVKCLKPGGHIFVGHAETLYGFGELFTMIQPSIYRLNECS